LTQSDVQGIGIIGCGVIADIHAQAINQLTNGQLIAVYSRNIDNARKFSEKYTIDFHTDWDSFIQNERIDLVSICTPSGTHLDVGLKAAKAGKDVIVEKPIDVTVERGRKLVEFCADSGVYLAVIFQNRYLKSVIEAKELIVRGEIGEIFHADAHIKWFRSQEYYDSAAWRGTFALDGGGVLINQAIHSIDLLRYLVGDVDYIFGQTGIYTHTGIEGEDDAAATLRFKNGAIGTIVASTSMAPARSRLVEIHGKTGTLVLDGDELFIDGEPVNGNNAVKRKKSVGADSPLQGFSPEPHRRQFEEIIDHINREMQPNVSGKDSLKTLAIVQAIYESAESMMPIRLS
jgi:predicted dehydrogenase